jgi:Tfp pilus assembly protein FimT
MKVILPAYVATTNFVADRAERLSKRDDRGVEMVEWMAMLLVIAAIVAVLATTNIGDLIQQKIQDAVNKVFEKGTAG